MSDTPQQHRRETPTLLQGAIFRAKATLLQINRGARNAVRRDARQLPLSFTPINRPVIAESKSLLRSIGGSEESRMQAGKVQNLRLALRRINGIEVPAGNVFSFWAQVGRPTRRKGYVAGRELREGCIIPSVGGGLCQLSNALHDAALRAGFEIIERHAHTRVIPGSLAEVGRDATVFWNYVDLRFRSRQPFRIEAEMDAEYLTVRFRGDPGARLVQLERSRRATATANHDAAPQSCFSCGVESCFRHVAPGPEVGDFGRTAFLVDEFSPEFDEYIRAARRGDDVLFIPLDGKRFGKGNYAWDTAGFGRVEQRPFMTLLRSYQSRRLAQQGAARQRALLKASERLAESYASGLQYDATHLTVAQSLLPFLRHGGHLGGRTYDVLMTALPMAELQRRLDFAFGLHPESKTLADFRAESWLVEAEREALGRARRIITPHAEIASLFPGKAVLLDWKMPVRRANEPPAATRPKIVFPASTLGRKGAYELREAVRGLDVRLVVVGPPLEGADFWRGVEVEHRAGADDWLAGATCVVLPAFVEHRPRRLLEAVARGVPVIASTACGLGQVEGVVSVECGDARALRTEIEKLLAQA